MNFAYPLCRQSVRLFSKANAFRMTNRNFNSGSPLHASLRNRMGKIRQTENRTPFMRTQAVCMFFSSFFVSFNFIFTMLISCLIFILSTLPICTRVLSVFFTMFWDVPMR